MNTNYRWIGENWNTLTLSNSLYHNQSAHKSIRIFKQQKGGLPGRTRFFSAKGSIGGMIGTKYRSINHFNNRTTQTWHWWWQRSPHALHCISVLLVLNGPVSRRHWFPKEELEKNKNYQWKFTVDLLADEEIVSEETGCFGIWRAWAGKRIELLMEIRIWGF